MSRTIKKIIKKLYSIPIVWRVLGSLMRKNGVIVLMYHRVGNEEGFFPSFSVEKFTEQMHWIKTNCNVIHPDNFVESINNNCKYKPNVLITFDDGYQCCYEYAYPILKKLCLPAIVFLATLPPDDGSMIWTDKLYFLVFSSKEKQICLPWNEHVVDLSDIKSRYKLLSDIKQYLKNIENSNRVMYLKELDTVFNVSVDDILNRQMLTWDEVRSSLDTVSYGGHTHSHPIMSKVSEAELKVEIDTCSNRILKETGIKPKTFAYPNGTYTDYDKKSISTLKQYGFELAFTTNEGVNDAKTSLMEIKRVATTAETLEDFVWLISTAGRTL